MKPSTPKEDPLLKQQQQAAQTQKLQSIQTNSQSDTNQALRYFGARSALAGTPGLSLLNL